MISVPENAAAKMRRWLVLMAVCLFCTACIWDETEHSDDIRVGDPLPAFTVTVRGDGAEHTVSAASLRGCVSVVTLFSVTCPDCRATMPELQRAYEAFAPLGVRFLNISRAEGWDRVEALWEEFGLTMPYSAQEDRSVYELFAKSVVPRVYLSDENGIVRFLHTDDPTPDFSTLQQELNSLLGR